LLLVTYHIQGDETMMVPLNVCFQSMERDEQVVWEIDARIAELEAQYDSIIGCDIVVYGPKARDLECYDKTNGLYDVRLVLALPCREIVVDRSQNADADVYISVEKAFQAASQQFESWLKQGIICRSRIEATVC